MRGILFTAALLLSLSTAQAQMGASYYALLKGPEVVPPCASVGHVVADMFFFGGDECTRFDGQTCCVSLFFPGDSIEGVPTSAAIYVGEPGTNGALLHELPLAHECDSGAQYTAEIKFDRAYCPKLLDTLVYVVLASDRYPNGGVRGRLIVNYTSPTAGRTWGALRSLFR